MSEHLPNLSTWNCFACGQDHPKGLRLTFTAPSTDTIRSQFEVSMDHTGLGSVVHGGIVATVFDEAMVWTLYRWRYQPHVTATMTQRFRGTIEADTQLVVEAAITRDRGRRRTVTATLHRADDPGRVLADAEGLYVPVPDGALDELTTEQLDELDQIFTHFRALDSAQGREPLSR